MSTRSPPITTSRPSRSSSPWPPPGWSPPAGTTSGRHHDRPGSRPAGVLHRPARPAEEGQPQHRRGLPRHLPAPARLRPPPGRERAIVSYLTAEEIDALVAAPGRETWHGRRDRALLLLDVQAGLRVSELTGLKRQHIHLGAGPHVRCHGKGRKDRATPLTAQTVKVMRTWLAELSPDPAGPLFPTQPGGRLSRDAVERLVARHAATAAGTCPSIGDKHVTPHTLRHSAAMTLLKAGVDTSVIALWQGTKGPKPPRSTFTLTCPSRSRPSPASSNPAPAPAATGRQTACSRSSTTSSRRQHPPGYADQEAMACPPGRPSSSPVGITRMSA